MNLGKMMKTKPTFYRQRLLIALLESFGGKLSKLDLQKLLFLYVEEHNSKKKAYEFIPYHYGCYSFQASSDIKTLENYGFISVNSDDKMVEFTSDMYHPMNNLKETERKSLEDFSTKYKGLSGDKLISHVYVNYPYYTLNSKIAERFLSKPFVPQKSLFDDTDDCFFTIGYEGITFEKYINKLIDNKIDILCDVRKNPFSMKFGFSKNMLKHTLEQIGIEYLHLPELGIESENRQELNTLDDYKKLFKEYENSTLRTKESLKALNRIDEISRTKKIALTCFEKDIEYCHRGVIANKLKKDHKLEYNNL